MRLRNYLTLSMLALSLAACQKDNDSTDSNPNWPELEKALIEASGGTGKAHFVLPYSNEFDKIPQDPKNPITQAKIDLGALLSTKLELASALETCRIAGNYSCASCHFASAGFQAGTHQGISDGGIGFGVNGEGRIANPEYELSELDVQPVRSPSALNIAYQEAILWNGQFGAVGVNAGTEANWTAGTPKAKNHLGYHGTETQAIAAQDVHRLKMNDSICVNLNYKQMFDKAVPLIPTPVYAMDKRIVALPLPLMNALF